MSATLVHLGDIACRLEAYPETKKYFKRAARMATEAKLKPQLIDLAVGISRLLKAEGRKPSLEFHHARPGQPICHRQTKDQADTFVRDLRSRFPSEQLEGLNNGPDRPHRGCGHRLGEFRPPVSPGQETQVPTHKVLKRKSKRGNSCSSIIEAGRFEVICNR